MIIKKYQVLCIGNLGKCIYAINGDKNGNKYTCDDIPSLIVGSNYLNISCACNPY